MLASEMPAKSFPISLITKPLRKSSQTRMAEAYLPAPSSGQSHKKSHISLKHQSSYVNNFQIDSRAKQTSTVAAFGSQLR